MDSIGIKFAGEYAHFFQLKQDLSRERDKSNRLESDLALFVRERNIEVEELNKTIASLHDRTRTVEAINDQLRLSNMRINLETASKLDEPESKSINKYLICVDHEIQTQNDDQNDERCSKNEYNTKANNNHLKKCLTPTLGETSVEISNPTVVQSTKYCQQKDRYNIDCFVPVMHKKLACPSNTNRKNNPKGVSKSCQRSPNQDGKQIPKPIKSKEKFAGKHDDLAWRKQHRYPTMPRNMKTGPKEVPKPCQ